MKRTTLGIAALAATLLAALLVMSGVAQALDTSSMDDIYSALRIQNLAPASGSTQFTSGDQFYVSFNLVNTSTKTLVVPLKKQSGLSLHFVGTIQTWVERLGADPTIPSLSYAARDGNLYATGGSLWAVDDTFPDGIIPPGGSEPAYFALDTTGFPSGQYRYYVDYGPLNGSGKQVIDSATVDITNG